MVRLPSIVFDVPSIRFEKRGRAFNLDLRRPAN